MAFLGHKIYLMTLNEKCCTRGDGNISVSCSCAMGNRMPFFRKISFHTSNTYPLNYRLVHQPELSIAHIYHIFTFQAQETLLHVERMEIRSEFVMIVALQLTRVAPLPHEIVFCSRPKLAVFTSMGISLHKQLDCRVLGRNTNPGIPL